MASSCDGESYTGSLNARGERHGRGTVTWPDGTRFEGRFVRGVRHGAGRLLMCDGAVLTGRWADDTLEGRAVCVGADGCVLDAMYRDGELHGPAEERDADGFVTFRGAHFRGKRAGVCALFYRDGGCILGSVDAEGRPHGNAVVYVYPGRKYALCGKWRHGEMAAARFATCEWVSEADAPSIADVSYEVASVITVGGARVRKRRRTRDDVGDRDEGVLSGPIPTVRCAVVEAQRDTVYRSDPSTFDRISSDPLLPDPYESLCVYVAPSPIPGAGEGLFAKRDFGADELVSIYGGLRLTHEAADARDWSLNGNVMSVDDETCVDVPSPYDRTTHYVATLGHKANDDTDCNAAYAPLTHPRYGSIKSIRTTRPVKRGEEITVSYDYSHVDESGVEDLPAWYVARRDRIAAAARCGDKQ